MTVCIVDDHVALRDQLVLLVIRAGHQIQAAVGSFDEGLDAITSHRPDVAVIDNQLPDGLGVDLCRVLTAEVPEVRLVLHTGILGPDTERDARAAGASAVVAKSVRGVDLLDAIRGP